MQPSSSSNVNTDQIKQMPEIIKINCVIFGVNMGYTNVKNGAEFAPNVSLPPPRVSYSLNDGQQIESHNGVFCWLHSDRQSSRQKKGSFG